MTTTQIASMTQLKRSLLSPEWKICNKQKSPNCLIADHHKYFTGLRCSECCLYLINENYKSNKAKINKRRSLLRRKQLERERTESATETETEKE